MSPVLFTTATQMSLFEHVFKYSLRFYHMSLFWTPPCSGLLYSDYADASQSDCLVSSVCLALSLHFLLLLPPRSALFSFLFLFFSFTSFFPTLTSLSHLPLPAYAVMSFLLLVHLCEKEKKKKDWGVGKKTLQPIITTLVLRINKL